jgi:hypothetical protein
MRKGLIVVLAAVVLASCIVHSSLIYFDKDTDGKPNLLDNPSFNAYSLDPGEALRGWSVHNDPQDPQPGKVAIDANAALTDGTSLRIDASDKAVMVLSDAFKVRRYGGYYVRISARSSQPEGPQLVLRYITFRSTGKILNRFKTKLKTTPDWKKATISAGYLRPGVSFGRVAILIPPFKDGSVWIDDAGCWEVHQFRID